ncbi:hypothetical protein FISHEDRAFT_58311 [Fistulina hepatica ATCC 64428]|nr:hypothetical protein FISHEDRAFT_58311 [Fistulina hepatica ATCC 64428]
MIDPLVKNCRRKPISGKPEVAHAAGPDAAGSLERQWACWVQEPDEWDCRRITSTNRSSRSRHGRHQVAKLGMQNQTGDEASSVKADRKKQGERARERLRSRAQNGTWRWRGWSLDWLIGEEQRQSRGERPAKLNLVRNVVGVRFRPLLAFADRQNWQKY